tara:strand:+ start:11191 stop:11382 length:192 start_codon:yes stop_codon:yes gene_type:complete
MRSLLARKKSDFWKSLDNDQKKAVLWSVVILWYSKLSLHGDSLLKMESTSSNEDYQLFSGPLQ